MAGFFFIVGNLYALSGAFAGLGMEINGNTRDGAALGGGFSAGLEINSEFSFGLKTAVSSNLDTITSLETAGLFRYYLPFKFSGLFAQAELGSVIFFENRGSYPAFLGSIAFGWRNDFIKNWYLEPYVRLGYPFVWGAGFLAGFHLDF
jgi:hypothetical protein